MFSPNGAMNSNANVTADRVNVTAVSFQIEATTETISNPPRRGGVRSRGACDVGLQPRTLVCEWRRPGAPGKVSLAAAARLPGAWRRSTSPTA